MARRQFEVQTFDRTYTLDPHRAFEGSSRHAVVNIYDTLYDLDAAKGTSPALASGPPQQRRRSDGSVEVTIAIRQDVRFQDGSALTAEDVQYSLRRAALIHDGMACLWSDVLLGGPLAHPGPADLAALFDRIGLADQAVTLTLDRPFAPLERFLAQWSLVVSRSWCRGVGDWTGDLEDLPRIRALQGSALDDRVNGTGPFVLDELGPDGSGLSMSRNPHYWRETGDVDVVVFVEEGDRALREQRLMEGSSDFAVCQPESLPRLAEDGDFVLARLPDEWSINPLGFINQRIDPSSECLGDGTWGPDGHPADAWRDPRLRRMLHHAFDADEFGRRALDRQVIHHESIFPAPGAPGARLPRVGHDIDAARECWRQAWGGVPATRGMHLRIDTHQGNASRVIAAEILAEGLRRVDRRITVSIRELPLGALTERVYSGAFSLAWIGWAGDYADPYAFASTLVHSAASIPQALGIHDALIDDAVEHARTDPDAAERSFRMVAERTHELDLYLTTPGKVSYMTYASRWADVSLKNEIPHSLDYRRIRSA